MSESMLGKIVYNLNEIEEEILKHGNKPIKYYVTMVGKQLVNDGQAMEDVYHLKCKQTDKEFVECKEYDIIENVTEKYIYTLLRGIIYRCHNMLNWTNSNSPVVNKDIMKSILLKLANNL